MKKHTLTIGITAFNEEKNIFNLLNSLINQNIHSSYLQKIIVVSDGSTDRTIKEIKKVNNAKIITISNNKRHGKGFCLDQICKISSSDILVLLDADITIKDKHFIEKLTLPIVRSRAELTSAVVRELPTKSTFARIIHVSMEFKKDFYKKINKGSNIYTCHGRSRALSRELYKELKFANYIADDAYSYLFAIENNFRFEYVTNTSVYYRAPLSFSDHLLQSYRFLTTRSELSKEFGQNSVKTAYKIPLLPMLKSLIKNFIKEPFYLTMYFFILIWAKISSIGRKTQFQWAVAKSSKN